MWKLQMDRLIASCMVKTIWIGQSAAKLLHPYKQGQGEGSETRWLSVPDTGVAPCWSLRYSPPFVETQRRSGDHLTNNDSFSQASSSKMVAHLPTTTFKRNQPFTWFSVFAAATNSCMIWQYAWVLLFPSKKSVIHREQFLILHRSIGKASEHAMFLSRAKLDTV